MREYDLIVIGGGSAGLAAAISAHEAGCRDILLLERDIELGGILLQCIHNGFGLHVFKEELSGPSYAQRYVERLTELGIEYKTHSMVTHLRPDKVVEYVNPTEGYVRIRAKAVILAMGCRERTRGAIVMPGFRPAGIWTAGTAQRYLNMEGYMVGKKIFLLGSGDIGLIMARRLTLEGAQVLGVAELMPYSNGLPRNQKQCLQDFGIPLYLSHTVTEILGKNRLEGVVIAAVDDKLRPIPGTEKKFEADTLLLSIGLIPENELSDEADIVLHPATKGAVVSDSYETSIPGIFACGNVLHVHDLVDFVSEEGAGAGAAAARYIRGTLPHGRTFGTVAGEGIGYIMPQTVHADSGPEKQEFMFRVTRPYRDARILIFRDDELFKTLTRAHLAPAEMEKIAINRTEIDGVQNSLRFEIACGTPAVQPEPSAQPEPAEQTDVAAQTGTGAEPEPAARIASEEDSAATVEEMDCIVCPLSCHMTVRLDDDGRVISIVGNSCRKGYEYAHQEMTSPTRVLTSTVRLEGAFYRRLPVITSGNIPKGKMQDVMREINKVTVHAPVRIGSILIENVCGLGVNIVASRSVDESAK